MLTYFKMKRNEWKVKAHFYGMIVKFINNPKDAMETLEKLIVSLQDTTSSSSIEEKK